MTINDWILIIVMAVWIIGAFIIQGVVSASCKEDQYPNFLLIFLWPFVVIVLPFVGISLLTEKIVRKLKEKEKRK